jgi:hypothetical protein
LDVKGGQRLAWAGRIPGMLSLAHGQGKDVPPGAFWSAAIHHRFGFSFSPRHRAEQKKQ